MNDKSAKKEKAIDISELRIKIDQLNEKLISGLKTRSRFPLNKTIYSKEFADGKTWIMYRLKKEQDLDSEFGRFLFYDQQPFAFKKEELEQAKIGEPKNRGLEPIGVNLSEKIIALYQETISGLCKDEDDRSTYGEATKIDSENILTLNERTAAIGEQVAGYKITQDSSLLLLTSAEEIRLKLIYPEREEEVIAKMVAIAERYQIENIALIKEFARKLIQITLDSEVNFILHRAQTRE